MPKFKVNLVIAIDEDSEPPVDASDILQHTIDAVETWGGQLHPDHVFFPGNIVAKAACRDMELVSEEYEKSRFK